MWSGRRGAGSRSLLLEDLLGLRPTRGLRARRTCWRRSLSIHPDEAQVPLHLLGCAGELEVHRSVAEVEAGLCGEEDATRAGEGPRGGRGPVLEGDSVQGAHVRRSAQIVGEGSHGLEEMHHRCEQNQETQEGT